MGTSKAMLLFDGTPLIVHIVRALQGSFPEVVVVAAPGQQMPELGVTVVRDEVAYQGPVGGLCYGLRASGGEASFVTSCDSAFLNADLISYLLAQIPEHDVVVPHWQGRFQPLHAVYRRSVLPLLESQLARGELRPVYLFDRVRTRRVEEQEIRRFDPDGATFFNINTPDDYAVALARWDNSRRASLPPPDGVHCRVELFGAARMFAETGEVTLSLPANATFAHVFAALAEKLPRLVGRVITRDGTQLIDGYACNVNDLTFVRSAAASVNPGDAIMILSADAGG